MNSDVHRHQAHPPLAQHGVHGGGGACGWYSASATPAPTAPARLKRAQPPHQLPSGGGIVTSNGPHAPLSPTALQNSVPHNNVMSSSVQAPAPPGPVTAMHTSQNCNAVAPKGPTDVLVNSSAQPPPAANRLVNMTQWPWHHGAISRERAEALLSGSADGVFLVRESTNFPGDHTLCVRYRGHVEHYRSVSRERAEALLSGSADGVFLVRESTNFPGDHTLCVRYRGHVEHYRSVSRERAEALLSGSADGVFLVRESTNFPGDHTLCVRYRGHVEHYRVKWATAPDSQTQRLTIDDEEFFDNMTDLIHHYLQDADGLCTKLVRCLPKAAPNGANNNPHQPPYPPHPQQPPPYPPTPHVPAAHFQHTYSTQAVQPQPPSVDQTDAASKFVDARWIIAERDLEIRENIGKGEFGDVMLGILNGSQKVAVKILKDREAASKFRAEASVMASLKHDNLVRLLGLVFSSSGSTCIVTEHCAQGSLLDYLRSRGRHYVTQRDQINFAYDTCCGMEYLEKQRVVHRDLAARNVLISQEGTAKVADFGLARTDTSGMDDPADALRLQAKLPIKWTAPEALKYNKFSNKSDMWSFGILLWEIYSFGRVPYPRIPLAEVVRHVERGYRMEAPEGCPAGPYEVMRAAWHAEPAQRPTFAHTRRTLATIRDHARQQPPAPHQPAPQQTAPTQ
ncbi:hypothetical protein O0L34_g15606 [Tuta absoluta]|nr:hypothetical protein O0L34_g15606 [Tuta absoluta]